MEKRLEGITQKDEFLNLAQRFLEESASSDDDDICIDPSNKNRLKRPKKFEYKKGADPGIRKKRRDKEEIETSKNNKFLAKIERENQAAKNSKCEQYLYCHCSRLVTMLDPSISMALTNLFNERKISEQLIIEDKDKATVIWKRKDVIAHMENNKVERVENWITQHVILLIIDGDTFDVVVSTGLLNFVDDVIRGHKPENQEEPHLTIAVIGSVKTNTTQIHFLSFKLYEKTKTQLRFLKSSAEVCALIAQMHRAIAKYIKKEEKAIDIHLEIEKGIHDGPNLIEDWWGRMIGHVYRMPEDCRRVIIQRYPNPFILMDKLTKIPAGEAIQHLAEIRTENGRFLGPALAQKLFFILTSNDGMEVLDKQ